MRLRRHGLDCGGVQVLIRDANFKNISRQKQLSTPTHLMKDIYRAALELMEGAWKAPNPIRMITVTAIHLLPLGEGCEQLDLLSANAPQKKEKQEKLEGAMDAIRHKFGKDAIAFGTATSKIIREESEE